ncbi:hypothetical protein M9H77_16108 [Catharanthus roseus]|uniref:Uncharacterized protein n=1 Tax=Catharanthus roseus TaxID=4058 RepID=A0ACC0B0I8_CATRO|nr:hypothetical protein M9H77_16108 [Catharanthus roseus]
MEEVPTHVHLCSIVPDVLTRQHEHRSGLIWSGDCETFRGCTIDSGSPSTTSDLGLVMYSCIASTATSVCSANPLTPLGAMWCTLRLFVWLPYYDRGFVPSDLWLAEMPLICYEIVEYHYPGRVMRQLGHEYIRWHRDITQVYIGNPTRRDTRTIGYQLTGVDRRMMEVDDMARGVLEGPPSSPTQYASFAKKV